MNVVKPSLEAKNTLSYKRLPAKKKIKKDAQDVKKANLNAEMILHTSPIKQ